MTDSLLVLCTCANDEQALSLAETLVEQRLAACVNVLSSMQSIYRWEGRIERAPEVLLLIKTTQPRFPALRQRIVELHSYDTPEILAFPAVDGLERYVTWLREQV